MKKMFSEIVVACTLLVNACAVLNFKLSSNSGYGQADTLTVGDRIREFLRSLRYFRIFIAPVEWFCYGCHVDCIWPLNIM